MDVAVVSRQSRRIGLYRIILARDGSSVVKNTKLKPWQKTEWCIPEVGADFVAHMEDVLDPV
jgi:hypothetical protein